MLEPPNTHHLSAAVGWLELGNWREANEELERIAPALRAHPDVLLIRCEIYGKAGQWETCVDLGEALVKLAPDSSAGWIQRSFALHELKRTREAFDRLLPAAKKFPKEWQSKYGWASQRMMGIRINGALMNFSRSFFAKSPSNGRPIATRLLSFSIRRQTRNG